MQMNEVNLDSYEDFQNGDQVYFNHPTESWIRGTITTIKCVTKKDGLNHVLYGCSPLLRDRYLPTLSSNSSSGEIYPLQKFNIHHVIASCAEPDAANNLNDLLELSYLHDAPLLEQIRVRYFENLIYTHIGPIILALNPYDFTLPNYTEDKMSSYIQEGSGILESKSKNLPHAWTAAHYSYWLMNSSRKNQSIIVSGESGAGKTETAKIILKYIGTVSTAQCDLKLKAEVEEITQKVNLTSPILEAFGNAKTRKNDNSSRFGKFMKVFFTPSSTGSIMTGATIKVYLLEKSRIVTHGEDERGYHSFYQLLACRAADTEKEQLLKRLQLRGAEDYHCTAAGGATRIEGVDDAADFDEVVRAMSFVGITATELKVVWDIVAAVIHLLALNFRAVTEDECCIDSTAHGAEGHEGIITELLGLPDTSFFMELTTTPTTVTRSEVIVRKLRREQAVDLRDAVAKALYEALFLWLVDKIDELIMAPVNNKAADTSISWIGLLDIFGFENFSQGNSFEQLCINLANETLQNHYNSVIFTRDMEECKSEGINTESVVFYNNQPCLDFICGTNFAGCGPGGSAKVTNTMSLLHLLDDESSLAKGSDIAFRDKVCETYGGRIIDGKGSHVNFETVKTDRRSFIIRHYAGNVKYNVEGFRIKNSDTIKETLKDAIRSSTIPLVASLLGPKLSESSSSTKLSVGTGFRNQLALLMTEINGTHPHWVRCIKPHSAKRPRMFSGEEVMTQMRSAGVLDTVKIRQNSFSVRIPFEEFVRAHRLLIESLPTFVYSFAPGDYAESLQAPSFASGVSLRDQATLVLRRGGVEEASRAQVGRTRVFLKIEASQHLGLIARALHKGCVVVFQSAMRQCASLHRTHIRLLRRHLGTLSAFTHSVLSQQRMRRLELCRKEAVLLVSFRDTLILQGQESPARAALWRSEADALAAVLADCRAQGLAVQAAQRLALDSDAGASRRVLAGAEAAGRRGLVALCACAAEEAGARGGLAAAERARRFAVLRAALEAREGAARRAVARGAACARLEWSEAAGRGAVARAERAARGAALLPAAEAAAEGVAARRALAGRRALLLLQVAERRDRRAAAAAAAAGAAELVAWHSAAAAAVEAAVRRRAQAEAAARAAESARAQRREAARRRALAREARDAAAAVREARVALGRVAEAHGTLCRQREAARGRGTATGALKAHEVEKIRRERRARAAALAAAERRRHAAWDAQRTVEQTRAGESEGESEREGECVGVSAERDSWVPSAPSVSAEGSMDLVQRLLATRGLAHSRAREASAAGTDCALAERSPPSERRRRRSEGSDTMNGAADAVMHSLWDSPEPYVPSVGI